MTFIILYCDCFTFQGDSAKECLRHINVALIGFIFTLDIFYRAILQKKEHYECSVAWKHIVKGITNRGRQR